MMAPFYKFDMFGEEFSFIIAFIIGIGFGFFLERAGFGSAKKLTSQFYFTDMAVFKVMFTAIVTAMLGVYYLSLIGFLDYNLIYRNETFLLPQIVGGLILGFGFIIGGYCPGTSLVAASTGKLDGIFFLLGVIAGTFGLSLIFPIIEPFYYSTAMGKLNLSDVLHVPYGILVFAVVLMALGGFIAAEWAEKRFAKKTVEVKNEKD